MSVDLVPYADLSAEEVTALCGWFDAHGVDHRYVPIKPNMELDAEGCWHVEVYSLDTNGKRYIALGGRPACHWVTFKPTSLMPWRRSRG